MGARNVRALTGVLLLATVQVSCSGGGRGTLTRQQVVRQANTICAQTNRRIAEMYRPDPDDSSATAAALEQVIARQRKALRQLRALVPPDADAGDYGRWLTQIDLALDRADASSRAIANDDVRAAGAADRRGEQIRTDADRYANTHGLRRCARS